MTTATPEKISEETLALIASAVAMVLEGPYRILSVQPNVIPLDTPFFAVNPWSMEGRFQIFRSRHVR